MGNLCKEEDEANVSFKIMEENGDVYAVNLTQLEIQGHLMRINREVALDNFSKALNTKDKKLLAEAAAELKLKIYKASNSEIYFELANELDTLEIRKDFQFHVRDLIQSDH